MSLLALIAEAVVYYKVVRLELVEDSLAWVQEALRVRSLVDSF